jgi:hypothetical protein
MPAGDAINPKQFAQQVWYHSGSPHFLENPYYVHVGSPRAAEQRTNPAHWDPEDESFYNMKRNSGLYEVRLTHGARVSPELETDADISYRFSQTPTARLSESRARAGAPLNPDVERLVGFDAYPYVNEYEDKGSISLFANPEKLKITRRLR